MHLSTWHFYHNLTCDDLLFQCFQTLQHRVGDDVFVKGAVVLRRYRIT